MKPEEKKYTKKQMLVFAEMLMKDLLSTESKETEQYMISSIDLYRIKKVLNKFDKAFKAFNKNE